MENVELDSTWHRDAPAYTDLLPVTPAANISNSDTTSAVMVTEKPHFLQEFGEDIVQFARDEKVDEDTFKQLTESQILRMQKNMNMGTQTKLMAKQRSMNKECDQQRQAADLGGQIAQRIPTSLFSGGYTYNSEVILKGVFSSKDVENMMSPGCDRLDFEKLYRRKVVRYHCRALMDHCLNRFPEKTVPSPTSDDKRQLAAHLIAKFPALRLKDDVEGTNYGHLFHISPDQGGAIEYCLKNLKREVRKRKGLLATASIEKRSKEGSGAAEAGVEKNDSQQNVSCTAPTNVTASTQDTEAADETTDLSKIFDLTAEAKSAIEASHCERRKHIIEKDLCMEMIEAAYPFLTRKKEIVELEFALICGDDIADNIEEKFGKMVKAVTSGKGDTLQNLISKVLSGAKAKFRQDLVVDSCLESTLGYIHLLKDKEVYYVKYPTGQIFPFTRDLDMWVFYIKSLFVFQSRYKTVHHESIGLFFEKLLNTPKNLRSIVSPSRQALLDLFE